MNPWLRELVRTLAAMAVEDARAREVGGHGAVVASGGEPLTPTTGNGNVEAGVIGDSPAKRRGPLRKPRTRK